MPVNLGTDNDEELEEIKKQNKEQAAEAPPATSGTLEVQIIEANLDRNLDSFKDQDPFAIFVVDGQKF